MIFLFLLSCVKQPNLPSYLLSSDDCMTALRDKLLENNCLQLQYATQDYSDVMIRCHRDDSLRSNVWDTNWFRVSAADYYYSDPEADYFVKEHTICLDETWRIESYPPEYAIKQETSP